MKFLEEVRHLTAMGIAIKMPDGTLHPLSRKLRRPRGVIPVIDIKDGQMPKELREMIRRSRAEYRRARLARNGD